MKYRTLSQNRGKMQQKSYQSIAIDSPLVSILIPLYNAEKYLSQCLDSLVNQTYKNLEVIIINDGSTDNSLLVANKYAEKYAHMQVYSQENSGASIARNRAFTLSKGEYIQYLDADDYLHPTKISTQVERLSTENEQVLCFGQHELIEGNGDKRKSKNLRIYKNHTSPYVFLEMIWLHSEAVFPHSYLVHRSLVEKSGGWNESLRKNQDGEFFSRVILASSKVIFVSKSISYYRMDTPNSLSKGISKQSLLSLAKSINLYALNIKKCKYDFTQALKTVYTLALIKLYPLDPKLAKKIEIEKNNLGIFGYRYPKRIKIYNLLFAILGIKNTAHLHSNLLKIRSLVSRIKIELDGV